MLGDLSKVWFVAVCAGWQGSRVLTRQVSTPQYAECLCRYLTINNSKCRVCPCLQVGSWFACQEAKKDQEQEVKPRHARQVGAGPCQRSRQWMLTSGCSMAEPGGTAYRQQVLHRQTSM